MLPLRAQIATHARPYPGILTFLRHSYERSHYESACGGPKAKLFAPRIRSRLVAMAGQSEEAKGACKVDPAHTSASILPLYVVRCWLRWPLHKFGYIPSIHALFVFVFLFVVRNSIIFLLICNFVRLFFCPFVASKPSFFTKLSLKAPA